MLWVRVRVLLAALVLFGVDPSGGARAQQTACGFGLGFAVLHELLPGVVGDCLGAESHDLQSGDAVQPTTRGLLAWRKTDNWTAFTDGSQTWVNGPLGVQQRPNDARLSWEANPDGLPIIPPPAPGERCHTAGLAASVVGVDVGAGNLVGTFRLTNTLDVSCSVFGYPGALLVDQSGTPQPTTVVRGGGPALLQAPPTSIELAPGAAAVFRMHWEQVPVNDETTCSMASSLAITPPDEYVPLSVAAQIRACGGGHLDVGPVQSEPLGG